MGKSSPAPPPAPDYKGAAEATAKSQQTSQYTPYGSQIYSADPSSPSGYRSDITLAPEAQRTLDAQLGISENLGNLTEAQLGRVNQQYGQPMDLSSVPDIENRSYQAQTARLDPQWQQREGMERTRLANQGLMQGGEAYSNAMREFNESRNDAYQQARVAAISTMPQTYQLATSTYNQPLNTLNAIRTGAQIQNPQFQAPGAGTNYLGAAQAQGGYDQGLYNAKVGQQNAMTQGLFGLGGAGITAYGLMNAAPLVAAGSDRRLKSNIVRVGTHRLGIGIYEYDIFGQRARGVMADEVEAVKPEAVVWIGPYKAVYYGML